MLISLLSETKCGELFRCALSFEQVDYPSSGLLETWHKQEMLAREKTGWLQSLLFSSISVKGQNLDSRPIISCPQLAVAIIPCLTILCEQTWTGNNKHVPHLIAKHLLQSLTLLKIDVFMLTKLSSRVLKLFIT